MLGLTSACAENPLEAEPTPTLSRVDAEPAVPLYRDSVEARVRQVNRASPRTRRQQDAFRDIGTGTFIDPEAASAAAPSRAAVTLTGNGEYSINLIDTPIEQAAQAILGDILGLNFLVAPGVEGTVTVLTSQPLSQEALYETFETALALNGLSITGGGGDPLVIRASETGTPRFRVAGAANGGAVYVIPLRYIGVAEMRRILDPIVSPSTTLGSSPSRNILFASGGSNDIGAIIDAVNVFDVDGLRGRSVSLVRLRHTDPELVAAELDEVFESYEGGPLEGVVRFVPNKALGSILVVSTQRAYLARAESWIRRYELAAAGDNPIAVAYFLENAAAAEIAPTIASILSFGPLQFESGAASSVAADPGQPAPQGGARVVADPANNAIIAYATAAEQEQIAQLIERLDAVSLQVLLEATIAEVQLNDDLEFGVRWFFETGNFDVNFSGLSGVAGVLPTAVVPGFNAIFNDGGVRVALNALAKVTNVNVVSSPTLLVLDNREATLNVGDSVPIATQAAVDISNPSAPLVNTIKQQDTGVILRIRPRVNSAGRIILNVRQEVSDAISTESSTIDSPTIQQRVVETTVAVEDGQSIILGGLIRDRRERGQSKVPLLGDIPLLGAAFRSTSDADVRTELLIIIKPRIIYDAASAREVTDQYRRALTGPETIIEKGVRKPEHQFDRIFF